MNRHQILLESQLGQVNTGSPQAVYEKLVQDRRFDEYKFIWVTRRNNGINSDRTRLIKRKTWRYYWALATSKIIIDDQTFPKFYKKRRKQVYIQTWHGTPYKKMGIDEPKIKGSPEQARDIIKYASLWDALTVPSQYFADTFVQAYGYKGVLIKGGTPRNDVLINGGTKNLDDVRSRLDIPHGRKVVLYSPTFREASRKKNGKFVLGINLNRWRQELGDDTYLLIRTHYLNKVDIPKRLAPFCMDVSNYPDVNDLYLLADCMITDYSSTMFDYALLKRPMVFFTYDYENYVNSERGTYFDLKKEAPGQIVTKSEDLYDAVRKAIKAKGPSRKYQQFLESFCDGEDGKATDRTIEYIAKRVRQ